MTFKDIKNKALASYKEKVKGIKKTALTGLAGLVIGAGGASGAYIAGHWAPIYPEDNPRDTILKFNITSETPSENTGIFSYKIDLWNNATGEYLGNKIDLKLNIYKLGEFYVPYFISETSLYSILENANWHPEDGLRFEVSRLESPLRTPSVDFENYQAVLNYNVGQKTSLMNSNSIPEPSTLGLLGLGAGALGLRKNKKKD